MRKYALAKKSPMDATIPENANCNIFLVPLKNCAITRLIASSAKLTAIANSVIPSKSIILDNSGMQKQIKIPGKHIIIELLRTFFSE